MKKSPRTFWAKEEIAFFRERILIVSLRELADEMGVTLNAAYDLARRQKIKIPQKRRSSLTDEQRKLIKHLWCNSQETPRAIGNAVGKTDSFIRNMAQRLGWPKRDNEKKLHFNHQFRPKKTDSFLDLRPEIGRTTILQRKEHSECAHITGGYGKDGTPKCCGKPIYKGSYCKAHYDRFYSQAQTISLSAR